MSAPEFEDCPECEARVRPERRQHWSYAAPAVRVPITIEACPTCGYEFESWDGQPERC